MELIYGLTKVSFGAIFINMPIWAKRPLTPVEKKVLAEAEYAAFRGGL
jgi:hypothetical protein